MALQTTTDLTGRTVDIEALQTAAVPEERLQLSFSLAEGNMTRKITGIQKLVQRYAILFFSRKGDVQYDQNQGTEFVDSVVSGAVTTQEQIVHNFVFANAEVVGQLRSEDADSAFGPVPPDDERIDRVDIIDFDINRGNATLFIRVRIVSLAGDDFVFVLPLK